MYHVAYLTFFMRSIPRVVKLHKKLLSARPIILLEESSQPHFIETYSTISPLSRSFPRLLSSPASPFHTCATKMSDDVSYSSFLDKANQDTGVKPLNSQAKSPQPPNTKSYSSTDIPAPLHKIDATYTSDTDAPFEPVILDYDGASLPSAGEFEDLVGKAKGNNGPGRAEELSLKDFDPRGEYQGVIESVKGVVERGKVKAFRVERGKTRAEYFVVGLESGRLVGVKAEAVES